MDDHDVLHFRGRLCVLANLKIKEEILKEAHGAPYSIHSGGTKMYKDLRLLYWWPDMKKDVRKFVSQCWTCQEVKDEHQLSGTIL